MTRNQAARLIVIAMAALVLVLVVVFSYSQGSSDEGSEIDHSVPDDEWCRDLYEQGIYPTGWHEADVMTDCVDGLNMGFTREQVVSIYEGMMQG